MPAPITRDYFAELYVAGLFGDTGWSVYFPKRDVGFDFIATKPIAGQILVRPVQVKGFYEDDGSNWADDDEYFGDLLYQSLWKRAGDAVAREHKGAPAADAETRPLWSSTS